MGIGYQLTSALEQFDIISIGANLGWWFCLTNITAFVGGIVSALGVAFIVLTLDGLYVFNFLSKLGVISEKGLSGAKDLFQSNLKTKREIFFYFLVSVFTLILAGNLVGMVPFAVTITSFIVVTFFFSCTGFVASVILGFWLHGLYFFAFFIPQGTPSVLKVALVFIEVISYLARLFSLAIRLFANMLAGHALLKILTSFGWTFLITLSGFGVTGLVSLLLVWVVTILELLIAFLQAYVFIVLTSIYLNDSLYLH